MKIALITIHATDNYGSVLQAFATQETLKKYGDVSIINYNTPFLLHTMKVLRTGTTVRHILRVGKDIARFFPRIKVIKKFSKFISQRLNLTKIVFNNLELADLEGDFDVFVSGSDQIWKPGIVSEEIQFEPAYFLDFIKQKKKISYGSSLGGYLFSEAEANQLAHYLSSYQSLSVRETDAAELINNLLGSRIEHVLDPTLLLNKEEWLKSFGIKEYKYHERYILVYALKKDKLMRAVVKAVSEQLGMKVIAVDQEPFLGVRVDLHIKDAGPEEFIDLFSKASFVVTSSFHGVAFSLNFSIPFVAVKPIAGANRIESLLNSVGLMDRYVAEKNQFESIQSLTFLSFDDAQNKLNLFRELSSEYIENALTE